MAIDLVSRSEWGARAPRGSYSPLASTRGVKVHYTGGREDPRMMDDHDLCVARVRAIQRQHMDGNGWMDIGYSAAVCWHRLVFVGRGPHHLPAANGPGRNSGHYAVLGLLGNSGLVEPNDDMLLGILDAIAWLRREGGAGTEIKGHRDGYSTDCPGGPLYAWVRAGAPRPSTTPTPAPQPTKEEEMPEIVSLGLENEVVIPSGENYQPWWTAEWRDTAGWHPAGGQSIAPNADMWADLAAHVALAGLAPGEAVELGLTRHAADGSLVDIAWPNGQLKTVRADADGRVETDLTGHFKLSAANRGRLTIRHTSTGTVRLETASLFKAILHRYQ
ncbi:hypothetical protein [Microtetraspora glauca]|uniref:Peptidoglycan recognition protein family domain-containing protein n=1 Tax=Microtetraspora glauca TaxID=1996 RepID=A0ABV3GAB8_MICGL